MNQTFYLDADGRAMFVSFILSNRRSWGTFCLKDSGTLDRVKHPTLPIRATACEAQADLDVYAITHRLTKENR